MFIFKRKYTSTIIFLLSNVLYLLQGVPSLFVQSVAYILRHEESYDLNGLSHDIQDLFKKVKEGKLYVQKGFINEYAQRNGSLDKRVIASLKLFDNAYQEKQRRKQWENHSFIEDTVLLAECIKNFNDLRDLSSAYLKNSELEALGLENNEHSYEKIERLKVLRDVMDYLEKWNCLEAYGVGNVFKKKLVETLIYLVTAVQRPQLIKELWYAAASKGDILTLQLLLQNGFNVNHADCNGKTALHVACEGHQLEAVEFLLDKGAFLNYLDHNQKSVFNYATSSYYLTSREKREKFCRYLSKKGAFPDYSIAARYIVSNVPLIQRGASHYLEEALESSINSILAAVKSEDIETLQKLLTSDIPIPYSGWEDNSRIHPLILAVQKGSIKVIDLLFNQKRIAIDESHLKEAYETAQTTCQEECAALIKHYRTIRKYENVRKQRKRVQGYSFDYIPDVQRKGEYDDASKESPLKKQRM